MVLQCFTEADDLGILDLALIALPKEGLEGGRPFIVLGEIFEEALIYLTLPRKSHCLKDCCECLG